jgi:hypothetical protein
MFWLLLPGVPGIVAFMNNDIEQLIFFLSSLAFSELLKFNPPKVLGLSHLPTRVTDKIDCFMHNKKYFLL